MANVIPMDEREHTVMHEHARALWNVT